MIPISHRNGEVSEKAGSGCPGDEFLGLGKSGWKPLAVSRRKYWAGSAQLKANGFILTSRRAKKLIPVISCGFCSVRVFYNGKTAMQLLRKRLEPVKEA